jgi:acetylornithine/N-succinyldiaminopimelate aminotransferase
MGRVFIGNSGAEANEAAIKLARGYFHKKGQPRVQIVSALMSFHGRTLATATATGQPKYSAPFAPLPAGFVHVPYNDLDALRTAVSDKTCAVMLELIQGESGVRPADPAYVRLAEQLCRETGARLIVDEIQTGMGRTGHFLASQFYDVQPDIITLAKGWPVVCRSAQSWPMMIQPPVLRQATTAVPLAAIRWPVRLPWRFSMNMRQADWSLPQPNVANSCNGFAGLMVQQPEVISEVRGAGLMIGIELAKPVAVTVKASMMAKGYLVGSVGASVIRLLPPLILPESLIASFVSDLDHAILEASL